MTQTARGFWSRLFGMNHHEQLDRIERAIHRVHREILRFERRLFGDELAKSGTVTFEGDNMADTVLQVGQTAQAVAHEFQGLNGTGAELSLKGKITWASDDATVATVDPASGVVTAIAASKTDANGTPVPVNISFTDDALPNLIVAPGTIVDAGSVTAQSGTVSFVVNPLATAATKHVGAPTG